MARNPVLVGAVRLHNPRLIKLEPRAVNYGKRKRILDLAGATLLLLVLMPFMMALSLLIKLTTRGPVLYVSPRVGLCGKVFPFYKFRSMYVDADERLRQLQEDNEKDGPIFKIRNDPRITPLGRFMRKYSLDELPQLMNVFVGHMSLVGPRPPIPREVEEYDGYMMERLSVRPGITCYWQIMGRSDLSFSEWMDLDHRYLSEMSLFTDLKILALTPFEVIKGRGAY